MTPNGAAFALLIVATAVFAGPRGLAALYAVAILFAVIEVGARAATALRRALLIMLPLAAFMLIVWVGIVGRSPDEIESGVTGTRTAAAIYVATVSARLFLVVFILQAVVMKFDAMTPFAFVRTLRLPLAVKRQIVLTLSLIETLRQAVDRAHTALVASGIVTRRISLRNLANGWVLVQTVWLTAITTVTARLRDKWPIENTLALLDPTLEGSKVAFSRTDIAWLAVGAAAAAFVIVAEIHGTA
jgi:hypothetical protein